MDLLIRNIVTNGPQGTYDCVVKYAVKLTRLRGDKSWNKAALKQSVVRIKYERKYWVMYIDDK